MTRVFCAVLAVMFSITSSVFGQQRASAGIYGSILDSQGAVVPGAKITLVHVATNQARTTLSNQDGQYLFPVLAVGEYRISVEQPGFKRYQQTGLVLQVNDNVKVDVRLEVGELTIAVTVEAAGVAVETSSATLKDTVDSKRVVDLPLNGRNLADLTLLVPGVQPATGPDGDAGLGAYSARGAKYLSVNGSRQNNLRYTLDGGDNQDNLFNTNLSFPFPDAVQEFSVQTSNMGLEIGRSSGGAVNIVTKSGTNKYHGDVFWFIRNTNLNANGFFSRSPDGLKRNQGGFTLGGPVIKDKFFLFGGYQRTWLRQISGSGQALTMPAPFRNGDFSSLLSRTPPTPIVDPLSGQPFPGNIIPQSRFSRPAQELLKFSPLPDPDGFTRFSLFNKEDTNDYVLRGDYHLSARHNLTSRYFQQDFVNETPMVPNNIHSVRRGLTAPTKNATLNYTFIASPNLIGDWHLTVAREVGQRTIPFPKSIAEFGVRLTPSSNEIDVQINGTSGLNLGTGFRPALFARTNIEATHSWRWIKGRHNLVWGVDLTGARYNEYNVFNGSGVFRFNGRYTGFDQADYILGLLSQFRQSNGEIEFRRHHYQGFYGGDSFRVTSRLTFNFGLRWEPYTPITDLKDREVQFRQLEYSKGIRSPHFVNAPPGLFFPGDKLSNGVTIPKAGTRSDLNNLGPRFAFAWDVRGNGKTSIRGGYGIFYDTPLMWLLNNMNTQTPFSFTVNFRDGIFEDPYRGRESFNVFPFSGDFDPRTPFQIPFETTSLEDKFILSYAQNWNLTIERRMGNHWLLRLGYVGTKNTHLMADYDQNAPIYDFSKTLQQNLATINERRPRQEYQQIYTLFTGLNQIYNSLQMEVNKRFSRGVSVLTSYTWSKNIDYNSINQNVEDNLIVNPFDFFYTRGLADNDHKHRWVTSYVWDLPDAGKALGSRALSAVLGHWQTSGILTLQAGRPFSIRSSGDRSAGASGGGSSTSTFADLVGNLTVASGNRGARIAQYFNTNAVVQNAPGTFGNLGRNVLRGPGYANFDLRVSRNFLLPFREGMQVAFLSEFFNLFNRPQLGLPSATVGRSDFGRIASVEAGPRILQFGLKIEF